MFGLERQVCLGSQSPFEFQAVLPTVQRWESNGCVQSAVAFPSPFSMTNANCNVGIGYVAQPGVKRFAFLPRNHFVQLSQHSGRIPLQVMSSHVSSHISHFQMFSWPGHGPWLAMAHGWPGPWLAWPMAVDLAIAFCDGRVMATRSLNFSDWAEVSCRAFPTSRCTISNSILEPLRHFPEDWEQHQQLLGPG